MNQEKIGFLIAEYRKKKGLTQAELADLLNVSDKAVSNWETGKNYPDIETIAKLSDIFEFDFYNKALRKKKNNHFFKILIIFLAIVLLSSFFFLLYYFLTDNKENKLYYIECESIQLTNSYLIVFDDQIIMNLGEFNLENKDISNYTIYTMNNGIRSDIAFERETKTLTIIDNQKEKLYFDEEVLDNLDNMFIEINYKKNNTSHTKNFKLEFRNSNHIDKNENQNNIITLLLNNGYQTEDNNAFYKQKDNRKYDYDLNKNKFYLDIYEEKVTYNYELDVESLILNIKAYYENNIKTNILDLDYNLKTEYMECKVGDCSNIQDLVSFMMEEYDKIF